MLESILRIVPNVRVIRCKAPIVEEYERLSGRVYDKTQDLELMRFSKEIIRKQDPHIVIRYLRKQALSAKDHGCFVVVPDMRFVDENNCLYDECAYLSVGVFALEGLRMERMLQRDSSTQYDPNDPSEISVAKLRYHVILNNNSDVYELHTQVTDLLAAWAWAV